MIWKIRLGLQLVHLVCAIVFGACVCSIPDLRLRLALIALWLYVFSDPDGHPYLRRRDNQP